LLSTFWANEEPFIRGFALKRRAAHSNSGKSQDFLGALFYCIFWRARDGVRRAWLAE
jgi:hypothetical protein